VTDIGIVGTGISALHLALLLQQNGVATTLYADTTVDQLRFGRLLNNVCRFGRMREREQVLHVAHWNFSDFGTGCAHVRVHSDPPIAFCGHLTHEASLVDFRIYLPRLLSDYRCRAGTVVPTPDPATALDRHAGDHDLMVVATGGHASCIDALFPRIAPHSANRPSRVMLAGLFHGVAPTDPMGLHLDIVPGVGEIFQTSVHSVVGRVSGLTCEAVVDGPWDTRVRRHYADDPDSCAKVVLELLHEIDSDVVNRIDLERFTLTRPLDLLQGTITPTVRMPWTSLKDNRFAVALGDAAVLNDPVTRQGGNLASAAAWELGQAILGAESFDEAFCRTWEHQLRELTRPVTDWTTAALHDPAPHLIEILRAASRDQRIADAYLDNFDDPAAMWDSMSTPQGAAAFLRRFVPACPSDLPISEPDSATWEREQRLLAALDDEERALPTLVAADALLVTEDGSHPRSAWRKAIRCGRSTATVTEMSTLALADSSTLVTYRQGSLRCSTLWRREHDDTWVVVAHQRSLMPENPEIA
jgi:styrene monooxygenase A-like protein